MMYCSRFQPSDRTENVSSRFMQQVFFLSSMMKMKIYNIQVTHILDFYQMIRITVFYEDDKAHKAIEELGFERRNEEDGFGTTVIVPDCDIGCKLSLLLKNGGNAPHHDTQSEGNLTFHLEDEEEISML